MSTKLAGNSAGCTSRSCGQPAAGLGPFSGLALCERHLASDTERVRQRLHRLLERLHTAGAQSDRVALLRAERQSLEAEIEQVSDAFDEAQERLQQWRDRLLSRVQAAHDLVAGQLRDATEAEECSKEVSLASDAGDMRKVMELTVSMESWLDEAGERSQEFDSFRSELRGRQGRDGLRSVGDVAAGVQQLNLMISRHLTGVMRRCWLDEASRESGDDDRSSEPQLCRPSGTVEGLKNYPYCVTACSNTDGFVYDSASGGRVSSSIAADAGETALPEPCIFVSFGNNCADHLLVTSLRGATKARCHCAGLDWGQVITGLHCDSQRQLLYVAQSRSVTVTDLAGDLAPVQLADAAANASATANSCIAGVAGSADKLYLLDSRQRRVLLLCKDSGELQSVVALADATLPAVAPADGSFCSLALLQQGSKLLLATSDGRVSKVCSISGQLIDSGPDWPRFQGSLSIAAACGLAFVAESSRHAVTVLSSDGGSSVLQTLPAGGGGGGDVAFKFPCSLAFVSTSLGGGGLLIVADRDNCRLLLFDVRCATAEI